KPKRDALAALYAFMRLIDDVSDEGQDLAAKQRGLARWRAALDQAITGQEQVFDGNAAVISPTAALSGAEAILPALVDTFQRSNIIRDVHEDYKLGRVYLPEEDLARYGVSPEDFGRNEATLGIHELLRFEADRAWQLYEEGSALLDSIDSDSRSALWLLV